MDGDQTNLPGAGRILKINTIALSQPTEIMLPWKQFQKYSSSENFSNGAGWAQLIIPEFVCAKIMLHSTLKRIFPSPAATISDPKACQCGEVLKGVIKPFDCKVFGGACTPETPLGSLMVSPEGACAAYYQYGAIEKIPANSPA